MIIFILLFYFIFSTSGFAQSKVVIVTAFQELQYHSPINSHTNQLQLMLCGSELVTELQFLVSLIRFCKFQDLFNARARKLSVPIV